MGIIHFLNVKNGDCSWIEHSSGRNTVIDISNGSCKDEVDESENIFLESDSQPKRISGNFNQKSYPTNPINYLKEFGVKEIFRFILTHPDMDHMDGIKNLFENFSVINFWDIKNLKKIDKNNNWGPYNKEDWEFYQRIRKKSEDTIILNLRSGSSAQYYNQNEDGTKGGDGIYILSPTKELLEKAKETGDYNDSSYVLLYREHGRKIIFGGDSSKETWDFILEEYKEEVSNIDILIAPHHGRKSGGNAEYLDVLKPKLTLFGNAKSKDLDYSFFNSRGLEYITNNQAGNIIIEIDFNGINIYITNERFAKVKSPKKFCEKKYNGYLIMKI